MVIKTNIKAFKAAARAARLATIPQGFLATRTSGKKNRKAKDRRGWKKEIRNAY